MCGLTRTAIALGLLLLPWSSAGADRETVRTLYAEAARAELLGIPVAVARYRELVARFPDHPLAELARLRLILLEGGARPA